jgi:uncharacterized protein
MTFKKGARLNPGQVRDVRGGGRGGGMFGGGGGMFGGGRGRGGGGGGLPIPMGGGGIGILIVIVVIVLFSGVLDGFGGGAPPGSSPQAGGPQSGIGNAPIEGGRSGDQALNEKCQTGEDANRHEDCRVVGYVNSIQAYWEGALENYQPATTTLFDNGVNTGCGQASSAVGPFYCPADQNIYIDLGFFDQLKQLGAENSPLAQAYVISHEYGHHVQNLTGVLSRAQRGGSGPESDAVRVELQADCYAGVWAANAVDTGYIEPLTQAQINQALDTAAAVGDDRIQETTQGRVTPENWTHGSSEQRREWFGIGYRTKNPNECDTFNADL